MRLMDGDKYKAELLIGQDYLDEDTLLTAINILDCQPTIDAVPVVHAKWEKFGIDYKHEASLYECSACGKIVRKYWEDKRFECCPYCFARMDGE